MSCPETMTRREAAREMLTNPLPPLTVEEELATDVWADALREELAESSEEYEWEPF